MAGKEDEGVNLGDPEYESKSLMPVQMFLHEIMNPLGNVYALCELLDYCDMSEEAAEIVVEMRKSIGQLKDINNEFMQLSNDNEIKKCTVDVRKLVSDIIKTHIVTSGREIRAELLAYSTITDPVKLQQILDNIISNALKYSEGPCTVRMLVQENVDADSNGGIEKLNCGGAGQDSMHIDIIDNGIGMSADETAKIGTPFYRCKRTIALGTGLGWSVIKKISKQLGYTSIVTSTPGRGTTVRLSL